MTKFCDAIKADETAVRFRFGFEKRLEQDIYKRINLDMVLSNYGFLAYHERMNHLNSYIFALSLTAFKQISNEYF